MKQLFILIITFSILSSCGRKKSEKIQFEFKPKTELKIETESRPKKIDTTVVYWQTDFDTIRKTQELRIGNGKHKLELKTYSLNDSSIVSINGNYKGIYHDYVSEITLTRLNDTILKRKLTKKAFKDSLNLEFYKLSILKGIEYVGIRSNRLYFKGEFNVPDTDWVIGNEFGIFYQTEKKHKIDSWNYKDIGL
jgi:hypothetical protein